MSFLAGALLSLEMLSFDLLFEVGQVVWLTILLLLEFDPKLDYRTRNAMNNMFYANAAKVSMTKYSKIY